MAKPVYDTRKKLQSCTFKHLDRSIGVLVTEPEEHLGWGTPVVDVSWETVIVNTECHGSPVNSRNWIGNSIEATKAVITDLDKVIDELVQHRIRIHISLEALRMARRTSTVVTGNDKIDKEIQTIVSAEANIYNLTSDILAKGNVSENI